MAALTSYAQNKIIDAVFRAQALGAPATLYVGLVTVLGSATAAGTEVSGGSYARVAVASSLANWAGTQAAGTTAASSGSSGQTSNNGPITFPAPTANWGTIQGYEFWDAPTGGNRWLLASLASAVTVSSGDPAPAFPAGAADISLS